MFYYYFLGLTFSVFKFTYYEEEAISVNCFLLYLQFSTWW